MKIFDLEDVMISQRVLDTWLAYAETAIAQLREKVPDLKASEIPDEQLRVGDGKAEIFITVRGYVLKMAIPRAEYHIKIERK